MAVTTDKAAPYTSPKVVIDLIERHRHRGLPMPVDVDTLTRAGVSESLAPRTLQSLHVLDLITDKGAITEAFETLRLAPEDQFKERLRQWLDAAYADVLQFVDPATDSETKVRDAFRNYKPVGQQERMVTLFLKLYEYAGIAVQRAPGSAPRARTAAPRPASKPSREAAQQHDTPRRHSSYSHGLPPALGGLLQSLPSEGQGWTRERRDGFLKAFAVVLDFCFPVVLAPEGAGDQGDDGGQDAAT